MGTADFAVPIDERYFEDYQPGVVYEYGHIEVTEPEILEFATRFDPQPIHVDPAYAATGPFTGLIASGWHTAGIFMRLFADHYLSRVASLASPGIDELRWPAPVRPGDRLRLRATILEARPSRSQPDRGPVHTRGELLNQDDQPVLSLMAMNLLRRRAIQSGTTSLFSPVDQRGSPRSAPAHRPGALARAGSWSRAAGQGCCAPRRRSGSWGCGWICASCFPASTFPSNSLAMAIISRIESCGDRHSRATRSAASW